MIKNINNCIRVSKEFAGIGSQNDAPLIALKHVLILNKADANKNKLSFYFEYETTSNYKPYEKVTNVHFHRLLEYIQVESRLNRINMKDKDYSIYINSKIYLKDFIETKRVLKDVENWFIIEDLYRIDDKNRIIDMSDKYKELNSVIFFKGKFETRYLAFKPCVVYDNEITYPGVQLSNEQGILALITYDEYLTFQYSLENYINNFQTNSMLLLNMTYNHMNINNN